MFGERLKELRENKGLKQSELASILGIGRTTLSNYELDVRQPDFDTLEKIAEYFGVRIDYLMGRTDLKTMDEYIFTTDMNHMEEVLKKVNPETRKQLSGIFDNIYLVLNAHVSDNDITLLEILHKMYTEIWKLDLDMRNIKSKKIIFDEIQSVTGIFASFSEHKNNINTLLDSLFQRYIELNKDSINNDVEE